MEEEDEDVDEGPCWKSDRHGSDWEQSRKNQSEDVERKIKGRESREIRIRKERRREEKRRKSGGRGKGGGGRRRNEQKERLRGKEGRSKMLIG